MATIFGSTIATGKYAKGSNEPLAIGIGENKQDGGDGELLLLLMERRLQLLGLTKEQR